jgi:anti-sigma regulatory factor (Ser/Thr protein kinase)
VQSDEDHVHDNWAACGRRLAAGGQLGWALRPARPARRDGARAILVTVATRPRVRAVIAVTSARMTGRKPIPWRRAMAEPAAAHRGLSHLALFYRDRAGYVAQIAAFTRAGLAGSEPVLIAVPEPKSLLLRAELTADPGHLRYADMTEVGRNPARIIPAVHAFAEEHADRPVRFVGEPVWPGRSAAEMREAARHEALINLAFSGAHVTILCPYDATGLAPSVIAGAERTHPSVLANGQPRPAAHYAGPGRVPAECEQPLPAPPAHAEHLGYDGDLRPVRRLVARHARGTGLSCGRAADLVLAASEIAANTLRHTSAGGTLHIWHTREEILCQVHDQGRIGDPLAGRRRKPPDTSGQGLWVVNQVCDLVELRTGWAGTTVRLHMRLRQSPA